MNDYFIHQHCYSEFVIISISYSTLHVYVCVFQYILQLLE